MKEADQVLTYDSAGAEVSVVVTERPFSRRVRLHTEEGYAPVFTLAHGEFLLSDLRNPQKLAEMLGTMAFSTSTGVTIEVLGAEKERYTIEGDRVVDADGKNLGGIALANQTRLSLGSTAFIKVLPSTAGTGFGSADEVGVPYQISLLTSIIVTPTNPRVEKIAS